MTRKDVLNKLRDMGIYPISQSVLSDFTEIANWSAAAELEKLKKNITALEADVDHFFKLSGQYLERANKAEEEEMK